MGTKTVQTVCKVLDFHDDNGKPGQLVDMISPRTAKMMTKKEEANYFNQFNSCPLPWSFEWDKINYYHFWERSNITFEILCSDIYFILDKTLFPISMKIKLKKFLQHFLKLKNTLRQVLTFPSKCVTDSIPLGIVSPTESISDSEGNVFTNFIYIPIDFWREQHCESNSKFNFVQPTRVLYFNSEKERKLFFQTFIEHLLHATPCASSPWLFTHWSWSGLWSHENKSVPFLFMTALQSLWDCCHSTPERHLQIKPSSIPHRSQMLTPWLFWPLSLEHAPLCLCQGPSGREQDAQMCMIQTDPENHSYPWAEHCISSLTA